MLIILGIPTLSSEIHKDCMISIMNLKDELKNQDIEIRVDFEVGSLITRCRQNILKRFYYSKADYLLFIDADISNFEGCVPHMLKEIQKYKNSIIGITYRKKKYDISKVDHLSNNVFNGNLKNSILETIYTEENGIIKIKHLPTGFMMISREVIENLLIADPRKEFFNYFDCFIHEGKYLSEDYAFCQNVTDYIQGDILCYYTANLKHHIGNIYFDGSYKNYLIKLNSIL